MNLKRKQKQPQLLRSNVNGAKEKHGNYMYTAKGF
jgi:hypothetical protein